MTVEQWNSVKGYEELYAVSNKGRVKRLAGAGARKERLLKPWTHNRGKGYLVVALSRHGKVNNKLIHRLVAEAFIPNPENKEQVNHKDGSCSNNAVENLEWMTNRENTVHAYEKGMNSKTFKYIIKDVNTGIEEEYHSGRAASIAINQSVGWMYWAVRNKGRIFTHKNFQIEEIAKDGENHGY